MNLKEIMKDFLLIDKKTNKFMISLFFDKKYQNFQILLHLKDGGVRKLKVGDFLLEFSTFDKVNYWINNCQNDFVILNKEKPIHNLLEWELYRESIKSKTSKSICFKKRIFVSI